jgi:UDPglucose 6-dehydrogenase|tara:strand:- start:128 stop:1426 length:1299 start_codon:yes stop_codon:yes gene_type:complete
MKICIIGTGYVGLVSGVCFADLGNIVHCVDNDIVKINMLNQGSIPIYEPGLEETVKRNYEDKRLIFTTDLKKAVTYSDIIFICVGTPMIKNSNSVDLKYVFRVVNDIRKYIKKFKIIIIKSTIPVSTGDKIEKMISSKVKKKLFEVVSNPEFLREGEAIRDFKYPDRIIIGTKNKKVIKILANLYDPIIKKGAIYFTTSRRSAELIKYASNAFLATKISFINELANLCEKAAINTEDIAIGMGHDKRIGSRFLRAGPAYGGSCFPKDTRALVTTGKKFKVDLSIVKSVIKSNDNRRSLLTKRIYEIMSNKLKNKIITFLGVTFKPNTDDMRMATSLSMIPNLLRKGAIIRYCDPSGQKKEFNKYSKVSFHSNVTKACLKSDLIVIHTEWNEFKLLEFKKIVKKSNFKIYDMRNLYSSKLMKKNKINYFGIGR